MNAATALLHAGGYRGVSMDDVARKAGLQKSNLFHYYRTKEDLVLAVLERAIISGRENISRELADGGDPIRKIERLFDCFADGMEKGGCARGCLIGNMAEEMSDQCEEVRKTVAGYFSFWAGALAAYFLRHKTAGYFKKDFDAQAAGAAVVSLIEGATLLAKASRKADALRQSGKIAAGYLKAQKA